MSVSNQALTQKSASPRVTQSENPRYTFRCWLIRIGLNGQEFKNCRKHLLSHLEGNIAWLHPEDAIRQRERLKAERIVAREQRVEPVREIQPVNDNIPDEAPEATVYSFVNACFTYDNIGIILSPALVFGVVIANCDT